MELVGVYSKKIKKEHRFELVGGETRVVFNKTEDGELLKIVDGFAGLFNGSMVN